MGQCYQCGGYMEWSGTCPACKRNDDLATEQRNIAFDVAEEEERAKERLQHDAHIKDVLRKLLDLAVESLDNADLAEKKVKVVMQSATFLNNESDFFTEVKANSFLADCFYTLRLGANPSGEHVSALSHDARHFLESWVGSYHNKKYAAKVKNLYSTYLSQKAEQEKNEAEESKRQQLIWEKENAQREAERQKQRAASEARENAKKNTQTLVAIIASSFCSLFFVGGFLVGGFLKVPLWIKESNYTATGSFLVLLLISVYITFVSSKDYTLDVIRKNYPSDVLRLWMLGTGIIMLFIATCFLWKDSNGITRIMFIIGAIGLPMIPFVRGILGSLALGIVGGLVSLPISYIAGVILSFAYTFIMK
jgi:hypothetical protein